MPSALAFIGELMPRIDDKLNQRERTVLARSSRGTERDAPTQSFNANERASNRRPRWRRPRLALLSLLVALWLALPQAARGQDKASITELDRARTEFQAAIELEQAGSFGEALRLFRQVGNVRMTPQLRYHIAHCEERLGNLLAARGSYRLALESADVVGPEFKAELTRLVKALESRLPRLRLRLDESALRAQVTLDGAPMATTSAEVSVPIDPGSHLIVAQLPGRRDFERTVVVAEREELIVRVAFAEPPAEAGFDAGGSEPEVRSDHQLAYVFGVTGGLAVLAGATLFALREGKISDLEAHCGGRDCSGVANREKAQADYDAMKTYHWAGHAALGIGAASLGLAAYFWLSKDAAGTQPSASTRVKVTPSAGLNDAAVTVSGSF